MFINIDLISKNKIQKNKNLANFESKIKSQVLDVIKLLLSLRHATRMFFFTNQYELKFI
jgi:hypothetical protein